MFGEYKLAGSNTQNANASSGTSTSTGQAQFAGKHCLLSQFCGGWIIDSGASDHICCDSRLFSGYDVVNGLDNTITIPDGSKIKITHMGTVKVNEHITLKNVLFVPGFQFNLISVTKLCSDMNCSVVFTSDTCVLQGPSLTAPIALGKLKSGLYYADNTAVSEVRNFADVTLMASSASVDINNVASID
ncbi:hypothetical protein SOVF_215280, partial [Spinacia oleracea]